MAYRHGVIAAVCCGCVLAACTSVVGGSGQARPGAPPSSVRTVTVTATPSSSVPAAFARVFAREQGGVVRIVTVGCSDSGVGSGFLVSPTEVITAAHVVEQSVVVSVVLGAHRTTGRVVGLDRSKDLALVKVTAQPGYRFRLATTPPAIGSEVAAIGFPIGDPITFTRGNISGIDRNVDVDGTPRSGLLETDAAVNPGNSGGPLVDQHGVVVGMIDARTMDASGIAFAVPSRDVASREVAWRSDVTDVARPRCAEPLGPAQTTIPLPSFDGVGSQAAAGIASAFAEYFDGINSGEYESAWEVLSPKLQGPSFDFFAAASASTYDSEVRALRVQPAGAGTVRVSLSFVSIQAADKGPGGDTCDTWTLSYTLAPASAGNWLIDRVQPYRGRSHTTC